jgi:hypothetical protein
MSEIQAESARRSRLHAAIFAILFLGLAIALVGNIYQFVKTEHLSRDLAVMQRSMQTQITRLSDATSGAFDVTQERFHEMKKFQDSASLALVNARAELKKNSSEVAASLEEKNRELAKANRELTAQLAAFKQDTGSRIQKTSSALQTTNSKLDLTSAKLDRLSVATEANRAELKRMASEVATVRAGLAPAPPHPRAPVLRETADRNHVPFDLLTTRVPTRVGDIQIAIVNADPKRNAYTMDLYAGDTVARDRDYMVNEAVQFYVAGHAQPYEIVVTEVRKDEVLGYVSEPTTPRSQTSAVTLRSGAGAAGRP